MAAVDMAETLPSGRLFPYSRPWDVNGSDILEEFPQLPGLVGDTQTSRASAALESRVTRASEVREWRQRKPSQRPPRCQPFAWHRQLCLWSAAVSAFGGPRTG